MNIPVNLVFEDSISEFTMLKMLDSFGNKFYQGISYPGNGFGYIKKNIAGFNEAAVVTPFFVLTDLDNFICATALKNDWLKSPEKNNLIFRIAVKEVEAWLLADSEGFSDFTGVSKVNIPAQPELESDPKLTLINLVRRSRKRAIKDDILPIDNNAQIGPNYNARLMEYVSKFWDIERAKKNSDSLKRAYQHLDRFVYEIPL